MAESASFRSLRFAGEDSHEALETEGPHLTVRLGLYYPLGMYSPGDQVRIVDEESKRYGFAWITGVVYDVLFQHFDGFRELLKLERTAFRDPDDLRAALLRFYPDAGPTSTWTFITYRTYLAEAI